MTEEMNYIDEAAKLSEIMKILATHKTEIKQYFLGELSPRIQSLDRVEDRLSKLFILANADRLGTGKGNENLVKATATFRKYLTDGIIDTLKPMEPRDAHMYFLSRLCDIKGMDQKTANLFLKYLVMFHDEFDLGLLDWHLWEPYLHVPLDLWVLRLMGKDYLSVCSLSFEEDFRYKSDYVGPNFKAEKYSQLQTDIREVASANQPSITLDALWFVGSKYCSYHPLLCDTCWLAEYCSKREVVDWTKVPAKLKSSELEERKQIAKSFREILRIWKSENPGKSDDDFFHFLNTLDGKEWLKRFFKK